MYIFRATHCKWWRGCVFNWKWQDGARSSPFAKSVWGSLILLSFGPTSLQLILTRSRADDYYSYHPWGIDSQQAAPATSLSNANFIDALFSATPVNAFQACWHSIILGYMCAGEVSVELQQLFLNWWLILILPQIAINVCCANICWFGLFSSLLIKKQQYHNCLPI